MSLEFANILQLAAAQCEMSDKISLGLHCVAVCSGVRCQSYSARHRCSLLIIIAEHQRAMAVISYDWIQTHTYRQIPASTVELYSMVKKVKKLS